MADEACALVACGGVGSVVAVVCWGFKGSGAAVATRSAVALVGALLELDSHGIETERSLSALMKEESVSGSAVGVLEGPA